MPKNELIKPGNKFPINLRRKANKAWMVAREKKREFRKKWEKEIKRKNYLNIIFLYKRFIIIIIRYGSSEKKSI